MINFCLSNIYVYLFQATPEATRKFWEDKQIPIAHQKAAEYKMSG